MIRQVKTLRKINSKGIQLSLFTKNNKSIGANVQSLATGGRALFQQILKYKSDQKI